MATQIQLRRDLASNWTSNNPTLAAGEFGWESDTNKFKIGTGSLAWNSLGYASGGDNAGITFVGDDSTGTLVNQNETFKIAGTQNITAVVSGDTLTLTGPDLSSYLTSVSESDVTQHQAALSITESQISDLQNYKTAVSESDVTQHQSALSITESQITDLAHFSGSYNDLTNKPTIPTNNNELTNGAGYITASSTDTLTNKSGNISQFTNDSGYKTSVSESDVTQHQAALSVTESQISDLGSYITDANITIVGDDSTGTSFSAKDNDNIKIAGGTNITTAVSGDTITVTGPDLSSYATTSYVDTEVAGIVDSAPEALNTLNELSAALGDDANFATTTSTALGNRLRIDTNAQGLTSTQKTNAKTNLGLSTVASTGAYSDLSGLPTIPTNNNQLTNGAGYITDYTVTEGDVTQHQSALSITESQISDLSHFSGSYTDLTNKPTIPTNNTELTNGAGYITASSTDTLTNKSGNVSQFTNDAGYKTAVSESDVTQHQAALSITESQISDLSHFSGSYTDLTNKPTIPTNNNQLTNGAGYITDYSVTQNDVTQHQSALAVTESQITDLQNYITDANITIVGDDSTGTSFSAKDNDNIKITGTQNTAVSVSGDTITVTGPDLSSYATQSYVDTQISNTVDSAPETLNTLNELAAALGDDANFATTTSTALGNRLRVDTAAQGLTSTQKSNAKTNLGLATVASTGAYSDLTGTPTIPTNNNQLTNGSGYITDYSVTQGDVTQHQAALSITESQISDLGSYITASSTDTLTNKSGNISQWTNDSGYSTFSGSYTDLTNKPTIPTNNNQLTNGAGYLTSVAFADVTSKPTTIAGYGITDAFDGAYSSLSGTPTIPSALTDLSITDGSNGQVLTTDGAGNFSFTTVSGGAADTGDITFTGSTISAPSNADLTLQPGGTGKVVIDGFNFPTTDGSNGQVLTTDGAGNLSFTTVSGGAASTGDIVFDGNTMSTGSSNADFEIESSGTGSIHIQPNGTLDPSTGDLEVWTTNDYRAQNVTHIFDKVTGITPGNRTYKYDHTFFKTDGTDSGSGNARFRKINNLILDLNGSELTATGGSRGAQIQNAVYTVNSDTVNTGVIGNHGGSSIYSVVGNDGTTNFDGNITATTAYGTRVTTGIVNNNASTTTSVTNQYGVSVGHSQYGPGTTTMTNYTAFNYTGGGHNATNTPYLLNTSDDKMKTRPGALEKFNEWSYNTTHSSGSTYTIDWANGNLQTVTLTSNITGFTMSNFPTDSSQSVGVTLYLVQDGTGSRTMTFSAASGETFKFANGINSSSVSSANDIQVCYIFSRYDGSSNTFYWTLGPAFS